MLSKKMAFSLTSLITILALAFVVAPAMAQFEIKLNVGDADVSFADGNQVVYGAATVIKIMSTKVVNSEGGTADTTAGPILQASDFTVTAYNKFGGTVSTGAPTLGAVAVDGTADGKHFMASLGSVTAPTGDALTDGSGITRIILDLKKDLVELADPRAEIGDDGKRKAAGKNKAVSIELHYVGATEGDADTDTDDPPLGDAPAGQPVVHSIERSGPELRPVTAPTFEVLITLSEEPRKDGFKKDHIDVSKATAGDPTFLDKIDATDTMPDSGRDDMLYRYIVVITPKYENKDDIVVKVKSFYDQEKVAPKMYMPPALANGYTEGTDMLTVKVGKEDLKAKVAGLKVALPKEKHIPAGGYLVVADNKDGSSIHWSDSDIKDAPKAHQRTPAELKYNTIALAIPNLETFLVNGGTIGVMGPHALMITEIMWGSDASLDDPGESQWIELYNAGAGYQTQDEDNTTYLIFYGPGETPVTGLHDVVGTVDDTAGYWSVQGKGQSGRTAEKVAGEAAAQVPTSPIISMTRVPSATGGYGKGTLAGSWVQSTPPSSNFEANRLGVHIGSPGAIPVTFPEPPAPKPEPTPEPVIPVAAANDIMITEIMVDTGNGRLPQWIELNNVSGKEVSLAGWSLEIENDAADTDAVSSRVEIDLIGTLGVSAHAGNTGKGNSLLLVSRVGRSSANLEGNKNIMDVSSVVGERGHYKLISDMAFLITLVPPQKTGVFTPGDMAGNLDANPAWELPMDEAGRSSLIRHEMDAGMATMGTAANGWVLASNTTLTDGPATWYGSDEDAGTPGYDSGGPLPVELSHFRPARDKATGAVVITWATQSELNNAGFFIKRSNQRDGEFKVINATMVPGAGTTSEKQFYTYTDTTAQPNIVYYYQIEDVSLDGNRQTLTRGIRLKGHIGAAGKLTSTWGEIKASNE